MIGQKLKKIRLFAKMRRGRGNGELEPLSEFIPRLVRETACSHEFKQYGTSSKFPVDDGDYLICEGIRWLSCDKCGAGKEEAYKERRKKPDWVKQCEAITKPFMDELKKKK